MPTVAFNFRKVRKGNVTMKIWDVAGTPLLPSSSPLARSLLATSLGLLLSVRITLTNVLFLACLKIRSTSIQVNVGAVL